MSVYLLTWTDYENKCSMVVGVFSSYAKAWDVMVADGKTNIEDVLGAENFTIASDSNPEMGIGTRVYTRKNSESDTVFASSASSSYNINRLEMDEVLEDHEQIEL